MIMNAAYHSEFKMTAGKDNPGFSNMELGATINNNNSNPNVTNDNDNIINEAAADEEGGAVNFARDALRATLRSMRGLGRRQTRRNSGEGAKVFAKTKYEDRIQSLW